MESAEARRMCMDAHVDNVEDIIVVNAANRPGTKDSFPIYCKNKLEPEGITVLHEDLRQLFSKTQCILLYQEQALAMFRYAGFPEDDVDNARRAIGKKKIDVMKALYIDFQKGLLAKGWDDKQIEEIWELMVKQASYCFNRGHAVAYGLLSYLTAYLKTHYPVEFMAALLTAKSDKTEKLSGIISDCKRMGIKVSPPHINKSQSEFTPLPKNKEILFGMAAVKGLGGSSVDQIIANRPYLSFKDYLSKVKDKSATISLIKAGAFPTKSKKKLMQQYAESQYIKKEYKPLKSHPSAPKLLVDYGIDVNDYKVGKKTDWEPIMELVNHKRKEAFDADEKARWIKYANQFKRDYMQDEFLWEFQALSMFVTDNPLKTAADAVGINWAEVPNGASGTVLAVISNIQRKKDRHGGQFAYLDLVLPEGMVEATIWSKQLMEYADLIVKGNALAIIGRKDKVGNQLFVSKVKPFEQWQKDIEKNCRKKVDK